MKSFLVSFSFFVLRVTTSSSPNGEYGMHRRHVLGVGGVPSICVGAEAMRKTIDVVGRSRQSETNIELHVLSIQNGRSM